MTQAPPQDTTPDALTTADVDGLGAIGQWMIAPDGQIARWLGYLHDGLPFREPINVIFVDTGAKDGDDAQARLDDAMHQAGFPGRTGHSSGYGGVIGGTVYGQLPEAKDHAYSTHVFMENNDHGRLFGPAKTDAGWVFIGALSRENVDYEHVPPQHRYSSFDRARDELVTALDKKTIFKRTGTAPLNNAAGDGDGYFTGDHDGLAVIVTAS
ncbi:MAG: hypothetical protein QM774_09790 [Gordonia sp. (in: high G+C Gram-positive bacteria)]|uniref:hypothetical protein n=1 Tax=Gordonia sp. (in: high G+C Gram-positive bacteria) TaxID=84139 RepID=UPI0039E30D25